MTVHYNTPEMTSRLVRDFPRRTPTGRAIFIHVLDNCSTTENLRLLRANIEGLPGVTLVVSDVNLGFGKGMNTIASSDIIDESDILWLLNPDTKLSAGCLELLERELDAGYFAVVAPLIYSGDETDPWIWFCGGSISMRGIHVRHQLYGCKLAEAPDETFETEFVTGAAPMMRASTFRSVGGFPDNYFLYWEDTYLSWKVRSQGSRLGIVPSAHLWHAVGASSGFAQSPTFYYWVARNRFTFAKDIGIPRRRLIFGFGGLESLRPIARAALREPSGRWSKARAAIRGTLSGLRV
ncbi:glycosyltransferase family 2 protein [Mycolicibacterium sphagni]|uniref:glycosyltransferase family 2 protein n=1 Tax=Mycolicibacterium sphagni TaxID=1786 RepID=UPI0021F39D08|nr:glycosyltransferase family 2 protein [Mycolicibacterium sphagni]MCV7177489.1 glycosyltransferase family 2 protein [Mycolicibacterium sphagni]